MLKTTPSQPNSAEITIAVVGDVHELWEPEDHRVLHHLGVDLVLLVGDFGNEVVELVREIASLDIPKAVILGNHDAWYSASEWGQKKCPYDRKLEDRVKQQLDLLGDAHVGYGKLDFPALNLTVVGSRPFSWGGQEWKNSDFYRDRYHIHNFAESTSRIVSQAQHATQDTLIFLGHNGPFGLGSKASDPCGRDWHVDEGDFGDPDFAEAIKQTRNLGKHLPLVIFGHMHHSLKKRSYSRNPISIDAEQTIYYNSAIVPRIVRTAERVKRNFSLITMQSGLVSKIDSIWIDQNLAITTERIFTREVSSEVLCL